jgi:hypothetical protein
MTNHQYGPKGHIVDAFLEHLKQMTKADWLAVSAALDAALDAAEDTAGYAAWYAAAWYAARDTAGYAASNAIWHTTTAIAAGYVALPAARYAVWEILGADLLRERGQLFFFLPLFGFADERAIIKQENAV